MQGVLRVSVLLVLTSLLGCASQVTREDLESEPVGESSQALAGGKGNLLALGDSIAFGYDPTGDFTKDKSFVGYPELLKERYTIKNASCPGETSGSLFSTTAPDNGCRRYRAAYPLHVNYGSNSTQLDYALSRIAEPIDAPTLITLNVSGNDIFLLQARCATDPAGYQACFSANIGSVIGAIANNVATVFGSIRGAGYQGDLVFQTLYATNYTDPATVAVVTGLNQTVANVARLFGARIADGYGAFLEATGGDTPCEAGLLIELSPGVCDVHPSPIGAEVLAQSIVDAQ